MINTTALAVFAFLFLIVTVLGFSAARWRRGDLAQLHEWGLGGRRFGIVISWFLIGGDLYTAYTLIAVPALIFGTGAPGFFAMPYTVIAYPVMLVIMPRLWNVARRHNLVTAADFVHARYGSTGLALAIAATGMLATVPYIALQLVGIQVVIAQMGLVGSGWLHNLPLVIAFVILATYTYLGGLRASALIAVVKDLLIYVVVIAAIAAIQLQLGGFGHVFAAAQAHFAALSANRAAATGSIILAPKAYWGYSTLALGSALALFIYPHAVTGVLSAARVEVVRRNAVVLPAYSILLGLIALLGYAAIAAGVNVSAPSLAVPALFEKLFPSWFVGVAFAAIGIGALVPAAVMSIAAANLWTRNIYKAYLHPHATDRQEAQAAKSASLVVKIGALLFVLCVPTVYAIDLQLLGGIWILQTFPAIVLGLWQRWFHHRALFWGWLVGMLTGTTLSFSQGIKPTYTLTLGNLSIPAYIGLEALVLNLLVALTLTWLLDRARVTRGSDKTLPEDYLPANL